MTIGVTHDSTISRVRIACSSAPADADYATIERSGDGGITWSTVRGGDAVALVSGACQLDDFEFVPNVLNTYRARYVDTANPSLPALGTVGSGVNASVSPGLPAGLQDNDIMLLLASIRNTAGSVNTPAGWNLLVDGGNMRLFTRVWQSGDVAPTVTFTGGVAGADTIARIGMVRNADFTLIPTAVQSNVSAQDIAAPVIAAAPITPNLLLRIGWKQSASTLSSMAGGWVAYSRESATAGDDSTQLWWSKVTSDDEPVGTFVMTGGSAAISKSASVRITRKPYVSQESTTITPPLSGVWLKNVQRPFLNKLVTATDWTPVRRPSRNAEFDVIGRSNPVAVTGLRGSKRYTLTIMVESLAEADEMDTVLSSGSVVFLHVPADCPFPGGYYSIGDVEMRRGQSVRSGRRYFDLPLVEVAPPASTVVGTTYTWQGVINDYATWADLIAANATWADLLERVGDPTDVVVP